MKLNLETKYSIGDVVQLYRDASTYKVVNCPVCKGDYMVDNPNYDAYNVEDEEEPTLVCGCCAKGMIRVKTGERRSVDSTKHRITDLIVSVASDGSIDYKYALESTPELNEGTKYYVNTAVAEDTIAVKCY